MTDANGSTGPEQLIGVVVIHGVGGAETGWINEHIVDPVSSGERLKADDYSEWHRLPDTGQFAEGARFGTILRSGRREGARIKFAEMRWSDITQVGNNQLGQLMASIKLFFEAPDVLAHALLRGPRPHIHWLIGFCILWSSRLLKWFVIGLNLAIITCAFWMAIMIAVVAPALNGLRWHLAGLAPWVFSYDHRELLFWLIVPIGGLFAYGIRLFLRRRQRDISLTDFGLADFGYGLAISSMIVLAYVMADYWFDISSIVRRSIPNQKDASQFDIGRLVVFGVWIVWCVSTLLAMLLLLGVGLWRAVFRVSEKSPVPLEASWVAIFNILVQAIVLKLVITPLSIFSCSRLNEAAWGTGRGAACSQDASTGVLFFALAESVCIALVLGIILMQRSRRAQRGVESLAPMPRLIVNGWLIWAAAITVTAHIVVFFGEISNLTQLEGSLGFQLPDYASVLPLWLSSLLTVAVPLYIALLWSAQKYTRPVIHIASQLVDHQYRPDSSIARIIDRNRPDHALLRAEYPRRFRIATRLEAILSKLVADKPLDKLILLTHSQGSVIAFDFLRAEAVCPALARVGSIHVVTLGSPLSNVYARYLNEYRPSVPRDRLRGKVKSWHNLWRIDDPIGGAVNVVDGEFIQNWMIGRGGHVNYWKENEVRGLLTDLIEEREPLCPPTAKRVSAPG